MGRKFVRNITGTKLTGNIKEPLDTNVQNDILSDDEHAYIRNKNEYVCLTDNIKKITSDNDLLNVSQDNKGNVHLTAKPSDEIDLSDYAKKEFVENEIEQVKEDIESGIPSLEGYATENYVDEKIDDIPETDLSDYATKQYVDDEIDNIDIPNLDGYATETYVDDEIDKINIPDTVLDNRLFYQKISNFISDSYYYIRNDDEVRLNFRGRFNNISINEINTLFTHYSISHYVETERFIIVDKQPIDVLAYDSNSEITISDVITNIKKGHNNMVMEFYYSDNDFLNLQFNIPINYQTEPYATKQYVDEKIDDIPETDLSDYATKQYVDDEIDNMEEPVQKFENVQGSLIYTGKSINVFIPKFMNGVLLTTYNKLFFRCPLKKLYIIGDNTENITDMSYMFDECDNLTELDVSSFNTENVTNMNRMFNYCYNLTELDVSNFNTENVTNMRYMFYRCSNLTELDVSSFNTENVTTMSYMFYECSNLTELDVSSFNTENVNTMNSMFGNCFSLETVYVMDEVQKGIFETLPTNTPSNVNFVIKD